MKYKLNNILNNIATNVKFSEEEYFSFNELCEWIVFDKKNSHLNETMEFHKWSDSAIKGRKTKFNNETTVYGDFLLFEFCEHNERYEIKLFENKFEILDRFINMLFNSFATITIPIIKGKVIGIEEIIKIRKKYYPNHAEYHKVERNLIKDIHKILKFDVTDKNFYELLEKGIICIKKYKNKGLSQESTYKTISEIKLLYDLLGMNSWDLMDELLDCISGYIGNKNLWIWENYLVE